MHHIHPDNLVTLMNVSTLVACVTGALPVSGNQPVLNGSGTPTVGGPAAQLLAPDRAPASSLVQAPCKALTNALHGTPCPRCDTREV